MPLCELLITVPEASGVGLDGVENVTCKYWFGLIFSILLGNWLCFLFWGGGDWFVKTLYSFGM